QEQMNCIFHNTSFEDFINGITIFVSIAAGTMSSPTTYWLVLRHHTRSNKEYILYRVRVIYCVVLTRHIIASCLNFSVSLLPDIDKIMGSLPQEAESPLRINLFSVQKSRSES